MENQFQNSDAKNTVQMNRKKLSFIQGQLYLFGKAGWNDLQECMAKKGNSKGFPCPVYPI